MNGKERGDNCASPQFFGCARQKQEQQHRIPDHQQNIDEMVAPRAETKHLNIAHVREPRQGMPVRRRSSRAKRPLHALPVKSLQDVRIARHILGIVVVHETVVQRGQIQSYNEQREANRKQDEVLACTAQALRGSFGDSRRCAVHASLILVGAAAATSLPYRNCSLSANVGGGNAPPVLQFFRLRVILLSPRNARCGCGEIGIRGGLKIRWGFPRCRFESDQPHHFYQVKPRQTPPTFCSTILTPFLEQDHPNAFREEYPMAGSMQRVTESAAGANVSQQHLDQLCINTIRTLSIDAVQQANSGHPGAPMGLAPVAYSLWQYFLKYDPACPHWPNRDRFVLSAGHASMLLYSMLHLAGVKQVNKKGQVENELSITMEQIKRFRQLDSRTPGHPESHLATGIETTTGPLGQGAGNSVGMAIAGKFLATHFNRPDFELFNYHVWALCGDGDLMEGVAAEAASLAGHLQLGNLCWIYACGRRQ
jgi:transketolase N-terminal domain/subunit